MSYEILKAKIMDQFTKELMFQYLMSLSTVPFNEDGRVYLVLRDIQSRLDEFEASYGR